MRKTWMLVLVATLSGCGGQSQKELAGCEVSFLASHPQQTIYAEDSSITPAASEFLPACMRTRGLALDVGREECRVEGPSFADQAACYQSSSPLSIDRLSEKLKL